MVPAALALRSPRPRIRRPAFGQAWLAAAGCGLGTEHLGRRLAVVGALDGRDQLLARQVGEDQAGSACRATARPGIARHPTAPREARLTCCQASSVVLALAGRAGADQAVLQVREVLGDDPAVGQLDAAVLGRTGDRVDPAVIDAMLAGHVAAVIGDADVSPTASVTSPGLEHARNAPGLTSAQHAAAAPPP